MSEMTPEGFQSALLKIAGAIYGKDVREGIVYGMQYVNALADKVGMTQQEVLDLLEEIQNGDFDYMTEEDVMNIIERYIQISINVFDPETAEKYTDKMWGNTGALSNSSNMVAYRVPIEPNTTYTVKLMNQHYNWFFDSAKNPIGSFISLASGTNHKTFTTPSNAAYFGFTKNTTYESDYNEYMIVKGDTYPSSYIPVGKSVLGYDLTDMRNDINELQTREVGVSSSINIFNPATYELHEHAQWSNSVGIGSDISYGSQSGTNAYLIPVEPNTQYTLKYFQHYTYWVDANKKRLSDLLYANSDYSPKTITSPATAAYLALTFNRTLHLQYLDEYMIAKGTTYPSSYIAPGDYIGAYNLTQMKNDIQGLMNGSGGSGGSYIGKEFLIFGDSITDPTLHDSSFKHWVNWLDDIMSPSKITNKAKSGTTYGYYNNSHGANGGIAKLTEAHNDSTINPDIIIALYGPNEVLSWHTPYRFPSDIPANASEGTKSLEDYYTYADSNGMRVRLALSELESIKNENIDASYRYFFEKAREYYPNAKIFMCTHLVTYGMPTGDALPPSTNTYINACKKRERQLWHAERLGIPVIDTFRCGIYDGDSTLYADPTWGVHLTEKGHAILGKYIANELKKYYL